jgi:hypothetical protein
MVSPVPGSSGFHAQPLIRSSVRTSIQNSMLPLPAVIKVSG